MVLESEALDPRFKASKLSPANKDTFLNILGGGAAQPEKRCICIHFHRRLPLQKKN